MTRDRALRRLAHRVLDAERTIGLVKLASTAPRWLIRREFLVTVKDLTGPLPPIGPSPGVAWRRLTSADIPQLVASSLTLTAGEVWRRLREGQECWVGWMDDIPAHWRWEACTETYFPYLRRAVRPLDGDLWIVDVYTHPARRRRGLYKAATVTAMHRARARGHQRLIGLIAAWNIPVRRIAEEELQRSVAGTVGYWTVGRSRPALVTGRVRLDERGRVFVPPDRDARLSSPVA
jgi:GNAT superfamily N-acetyltransferase